MSETQQLFQIHLDAVDLTAVTDSFNTVEVFAGDRTAGQ